MTSASATVRFAPRGEPQAALRSGWPIVTGALLARGQGGEQGVQTRESGVAEPSALLGMAGDRNDRVIDIQERVRARISVDAARRLDAAVRLLTADEYALAHVRPPPTLHQLSAYDAPPPAMSAATITATPLGVW